ncbi:NAD(P)-dependent oxidoreductase [Nocardia sp. NPDC055321]
MSEVIGFVGAGQMGEPMVARLLRSGHEVVAFARRTSVRERLRAMGADVVDSVAEVAVRGNIIIVCVYSDEQVTEVLGGPDGVLAHAAPEAMVVSHTTGSPSTVREFAAACPDGPILLDGPVSGSPLDIAEGTLTVLLGGPAPAVAAVTPVLGAYASTIVPTGGLGSALTVKLLNNALFAANAQLATTTLRVGRELGIEEDDLLRALLVCSGRSHAAGTIHTAGGTTGFEHVVVRYLRKDVAACFTAAAELGIDLGPLATAIDGGPFQMR